MVVPIRVSSMRQIGPLNYLQIIIIIIIIIILF